MGYPYGMFQERPGGASGLAGSSNWPGLEYVWHPGNRETVGHCYLPTGRMVSPGELRVRIELWIGSDEATRRWLDIIDLMAISTVHTNGDLRWRANGCSGMFAINGATWRRSPAPTEPGDARHHLQTLRDLMNAISPNPLSEEWWGVWLSQMGWPMGNQTQDWVSPSSVIEDNLRAGMGIVAPDTVQWDTLDESQRLGADGQFFLFRDTERRDDAWIPSIQDYLWATALRGAVMSVLWHHPVDGRKAIKAAIERDPTGVRLSRDTFAAELLRVGGAGPAELFTRAFAKMVVALRSDSTSWLPPSVLREEASRLADAWVSGDRATGIAQGMVDDVVGAVAGAAKTGVGMLWFLVVAAGVALVWYGKGKGEQ